MIIVVEGCVRLKVVVKEGEVVLIFNDMVVKVCVIVLCEYLCVNGVYCDGKIEFYLCINVGVVVVV